MATFDIFRFHPIIPAAERFLEKLKNMDDDDTPSGIDLSVPGSGPQLSSTSQVSSKSCSTLDLNF